MKTDICFDCYRIMKKTEEMADDKNSIFWICESCGKIRYENQDQLKKNQQ